MKDLKEKIEQILKSFSDDLKEVECIEAEQRAEKEATDQILQLIEENYVSKPKSQKRTNVWGVDLDETDKFFKSITKDAGQRDV